MHGHSRKNNVFVYGCDRNEDAKICKIFPYMLSKLSSSFSIRNSRFGVQKSKASTAWVALFKELKSVNLVYTLESSFAGVDQRELKGVHLSVKML